jgi:hypothetical protein
MARLQTLNAFVIANFAAQRFGMHTLAILNHQVNKSGLKIAWERLVNCFWKSGDTSQHLLEPDRRVAGVISERPSGEASKD